MTDDPDLPGPAILIAMALGCLVFLIGIVVGVNVLVAVLQP